MERKTGREMRKLMLAVSASVLVLVLAIIAYFMTDVVITTNRNIERNQEMVIEESVQALARIEDNVSTLISDPQLSLSLINQDMVNSLLAGDWEALYDFMVKFSVTFYPIDYIGVIRDGELVKYGFSKKMAKGLQIEASELPLQPYPDEYHKMDRFGNKEGYFVSKFFDIDVSMLGVKNFYVNMVVDRTEELAEARGYFQRQRNDLVLRLSIAAGIAVILSLLLTTLGLRYFTRKYVVKPIEELNRTAEEIASGEFEGDVVVDEGSAYAALQGLLRSGQKVLRRFEKELGD